MRDHLTRQIYFIRILTLIAKPSSLPTWTVRGDDQVSELVVSAIRESYTASSSK